MQKSRPFPGPAFLLMFKLLCIVDKVLKNIAYIGEKYSIKDNYH